MGVIIHILFAVMVGLLGFGIGYLISSAKALKDLSEIEKATVELGECYEKSTKAADDVIECLRRISQNKSKLISLYEQDLKLVYDSLVKLRDEGHGDLDEVIGHLGKVLGNESDDGNGTEEEEQV